MARHLFIVSREHPRLYEYLVARFQDDANVSVIVDRRAADRRAPGSGVFSGTDRRSRDRRQPIPPHDDLRLRSHRIVTLENDGEEVTTPPAP